MAAPKGVRKVSENIVQDGRALVINEEDLTKYSWDEIPCGSLHINPATGLISVKVKGETSWIPTNIKQDGTICIAKDSRIGIETFTIKEVDLVNKTFVYYNYEGEQRHKEITEEGYFVFEIETGSYIKRRNHLDVTIDDVLQRNVASGGLIEITEKTFALTEILVEGMEITARYVKIFNIGNPYPRIFIDEKMPEDSEIGDFWLDFDASLAENDLGENIDLNNSTIPWHRITGTPTTLKGYGIVDRVSYENHTHKKDDIVNLSTSTMVMQNNNIANRAMPLEKNVLMSEADGKISPDNLCAHFHNQSEIRDLEFFKKGMIVDWYGSVEEIPKGWFICNGRNGTPDLRDRFIVGAGNFYELGAIGGEDKHKLSIAEMPRHTCYGFNYFPEKNKDNDFRMPVRNSSANDSVFYEGGELPHENRPPFYALYKIMKS